MDEEKKPTEAETEEINRESSGSTTYDLRSAAEEALQMLANAQVPEATHIPEDDEESRPLDGSTTFDLKDDAVAAMRLFTEGQPKTDKLSDVTFFKPGTEIKLEIQGVPKPIHIPVEDEIVLGRSDTVTGFMPDVDLTPYGAYRLGLSRRHVILKCKENQLFLIDLGSRNGSYLNGSRLAPHDIRNLHNGDEIQLGKLIIKLQFEESLGG